MRTQIVDGQGSRTRTAQVCEVRFIEYCVRYQLVIASLLHLRCSVGMSSLDPHHMHMKLYPHLYVLKDTDWWRLRPMSSLPSGAHREGEAKLTPGKCGQSVCLIQVLLTITTRGYKRLREWTGHEEAAAAFVLHPVWQAVLHGYSEWELWHQNRPGCQSWLCLFSCWVTLSHQLKFPEAPLDSPLTMRLLTALAWEGFVEAWMVYILLAQSKF